MPTIITKNSSTATNVPTSSELEEGELAVNTADKRLFTENSSAAVVEIGINPSSLTTGVLSATSVTSSGAIQGTVVTATTNFAGPITGAVTGDVAGNVTGNLTGNVTGNITGSGSSSLTTFATTNLTAGGLAYPTADGSPSTVLSTNGSGTISFISIAGAYDLATQAEAEAGTETTGKIFSPLRVKQAIDALAPSTIAVGSITGLATGVATFLATSSSANLASAVTDETGSGSLVFATSPTLVTPALGTPASGVLTNATGLPNSSVIGLGTAALVATGTSSGNVPLVGTKSSTTTLAGLVERSTSAENVTGTDDTVYPTVAGTKEMIDTHTSAGGVREFTATGTIGDGIIVTLESDGTVKATTQTVSAPSLGTPAVWESAVTENISATFDSDSNKVVIAYRDNGNSLYGTAIVGTVSGTAISFGTAVVFESAVTTDIAATFDSNSNKVVIAYMDHGNSSYGTGIVGTVSGTAISFGTAVVFETASAQAPSATFDSDSNKVVIAYSDGGNSDYGTAIVGTVSGTSISFGTAVVFESANTTYIGATFDSNSNRVVTAYRDAGNSNYGTAIVGTVSGTAISFGTAVVFNTLSTKWIAATFDSSSNKVVIAYDNDDQWSTAIVGTVAVTAISFGTAVVYKSAQTTDIAATFDTAANKVVIAFRDTSQGDGYGKLIQGTVSGTAISYDTAVTFDLPHATLMSATFDTESTKSVIAYRDDGNSDYGTAVVYGSDVTTDVNNEIGIAAEAGTDGNPLDVTILGGVNASQSGLTIAAEYWANTDGTLSSSDTGYQKMGVALSATELLIRGSS
ncbi:MAG TPA: hypothetical protein DCS89_05235 [Gammaproteobacteria bacterium]|nr:hypothetical protein [Gammaproteobacteria bacterium]|tara:strand:+ start:1879 stop:4290 length:2412 start_codon:yes stop_codon:yes gene_type:complete